MDSKGQAKHIDEKKLKELKVLQSELKSLKKDAKVYKQQPNSNIFFREERSEVFSKAKKDLDDLVKEYEEAGKSEQSNAQGAADE